MNECLTNEYRSLIAKILFRWFLDLSGNVKLGRNILSELLVKWMDSNNCSLLIGDKLVSVNEKEFFFRFGVEFRW